MSDYTEIIRSAQNGAYIVRCADIPGTHGYCSDEAAAKLRQRLADVPAGSICLLGSGNYHYASLFLQERIKESYELVLFDHHHDMQPPAFGGLLSCGSWARQALYDLPQLRRVWMIGARPPADIETQRVFPLDIISAPADAGTDRTDGLLAQREEILSDSAKPSADERLPLYFSIDKDVLSTQTVQTDWDQGDMTEMKLVACIQGIARGRRILGADICGEPGESVPGAEQEKSRALNRRLTEVLRQLL